MTRRRSAALKPFARPQRWLGLWWALIAGVIVGSLLPALLLPDVPPGSDKLEHLLGYAMLAACAVQLFARRGAHCCVRASVSSRSASRSKSRRTR